MSTKKTKYRYGRKALELAETSDGSKTENLDTALAE